MSINYVTIGKRIKELRTAKNWTQAYLAEKSGIEPSNISHIERAATKLSLPTLISIANALGASVDEIIYGNLVKSSHISVSLINQLLSDCNGAELEAIVEVIKTTKHILRKQQ